MHFNSHRQVTCTVKEVTKNKTEFRRFRRCRCPKPHEQKHSKANLARQVRPRQQRQQHIVSLRPFVPG